MSGSRPLPPGRGTFLSRLTAEEREEIREYFLRPSQHNVDEFGTLAEPSSGAYSMSGQSMTQNAHSITSTRSAPSISMTQNSLSMSSTRSAPSMSSSAPLITMAEPDDSYDHWEAETSQNVTNSNVDFQPTIQPYAPVPAMAGGSTANTTNVASRRAPFQGLRNLGQRISRQVNNQRLAQAARNIPRSSAIQRQLRRSTRGPAITPPVLRGREGNSIWRVCESNETGSQLLRIRVQVMPPKSPWQDIYYYHHFADSFEAKLQEFGLVFIYDLPKTTLVSTLIERVAQEMQEGPHAYLFNTPLLRQGILPHEMRPLQLLCFSNLGRPRARGRQICFFRHAYRAMDSIETLFTDTRLFARPALTLGRDNRFLIHMIIAEESFTLSTTFDDKPPSRHSCLARKFWRIFRQDGQFDTRDGEISEDYTSTEAESSDSDRVQVAASLQVSSGASTSRQTRSATQALVASESSSSNHQTNTVVTPAENISPGSTPAQLWDQPWIPTEPTASEGIGSNIVNNLARTVYENAQVSNLSSPATKLAVSGQNMDGLVEHFMVYLIEAVYARDFSTVLSPQREFTLNDDLGGGISGVRSWGEGIEREVIFTAFKKYLDKEAVWLAPRIDKYCTIATSLTAANAAQFLKADHPRCISLACFGALTSLMLLHHIAPAPISPLLLHFFIHNCNLQSITPDVLSDWHPDLCLLLRKWNEIGPEGDLSPFQSHFATFHDRQVASLQDRDEIIHQVLAGEMLYRGIVGPEPITHVEIQAFLFGFRLPCKSGFNFVNVPRSYEDGGSAGFLKSIWNSIITKYDDLKPNLKLRTPNAAVRAQAFSSMIDTDASYSSPSKFKLILENFLQGHGIPCPRLFEEAKIHFNSVINLNDVDLPCFRSRMLCWAVTGTPSIDHSSLVSDLEVSLVGNDDDLYAPLTVRAMWQRQGKISFRTCFKMARLPASMFQLLSSQSYLPDQEPSSFLNAVHHWLLVEILNAIGNHTII